MRDERDDSISENRPDEAVHCWLGPPRQEFRALRRDLLARLKTGSDLDLAVDDLSGG